MKVPIIVADKKSLLVYYVQYEITMDHTIFHMIQRLNYLTVRKSITENIVPMSVQTSAVVKVINSDRNVNKKYHLFWF